MHLAALMGELGLAVPAMWAWIAPAWSEFARNAAGTLVASIWQGAVIVCALEIALRLIPRVPASYRFGAWAAGFVIAAGLPFARFLDFGVSATTSAGTAVSISDGSAGALLQVDARWAMAIAILWLCASAIRGVDLVVHSIRLRRLWKGAQPVEVSNALMAALRAVRGGRVRICTTKMLDRPSVIGFWSPRILIPEWLIAKLTPGELEQIVLHEAEHLRRCDDWTNLVQKLALVAFPLNPGLAWMEHRLCREREMACDEGVVRITKAPRAYAACLTSLAERGLERRAEALSLGAWHRRSELVHRVHGILLRKPGLSRAAAGALLGTVGCALMGGSVEMARCPQLVAFVPKQMSVAMAAERQQQLTALLANENAASKMTLPPGYRAEQAKVMVPEPTRMPCPARRETHKHAPVRNVPSGQLMAKAKAVGDRVNPEPQQQWVVLAAWEEVQTISRSSATTSGDAVADYTTAATNDEIAPGQSTAAAEAQKNGKNAGVGTASNETSRYTVTQLILRVVPANPKSKSTQPAGSMRSGWFVIQL
jgi:beta-lactamase regulating signal transducer with metallopeptidase domain